MQVKRVAFLGYCPSELALELYRFVSPRKQPELSLFRRGGRRTRPGRYRRARTWYVFSAIFRAA